MNSTSPDKSKPSSGSPSPQARHLEKLCMTTTWMFRWDGWTSPTVINYLAGTARNGFATVLEEKKLATRKPMPFNFSHPGMPRAVLQITAAGEEHVAADSKQKPRKAKDIDIDKVPHDHLVQLGTLAGVAGGHIRAYATPAELRIFSSALIKEFDALWLIGDDKVGIEVEVDHKRGYKLDNFVHRCLLASHPEKGQCNFVAIVFFDQANLDFYRAAFAPGRLYDVSMNGGKGERQRFRVPPWSTQRIILWLCKGEVDCNAAYHERGSRTGSAQSEGPANRWFTPLACTLVMLCVACSPSLTPTQKVEATADELATMPWPRDTKPPYEEYLNSARKCYQVKGCQGLLPAQLHEIAVAVASCASNKTRLCRGIESEVGVELREFLPIIDKRDYVDLPHNPFYWSIDNPLLDAQAQRFALRRELTDSLVETLRQAAAWLFGVSALGVLIFRKRIARHCQKNEQPPYLPGGLPENWTYKARQKYKVKDPLSAFILMDLTTTRFKEEDDDHEVRPAVMNPPPDVAVGPVTAALPPVDDAFIPEEAPDIKQRRCRIEAVLAIAFPRWPRLPRRMLTNVVIDPDL